MDAVKVQQQIVEKIKSSTNILVTVSRDPTVDELSAALGLTAMLDKLDKHVTAIFSGAVPPAITFLDPGKTFENTANSLQDFIIALNKEKADHLRYKVEGDVVKIFITPYRTTITSDDLEFSQGDYNVELVLALGVENQNDLDAALEAHGRILHDSTVATLSAGDQTSTLGSIDWHDSSASSLGEMVVVLGEQLKTDKALIDDQIATALLTGIVASTDRFSNPRTTSKVMTIAAQLMAAGADQQLIAAKLQESHDIAPTVSDNTGDKVILSEGDGVKLTNDSTLPPNDNLSIDHTVPSAVDLTVPDQPVISPMAAPETEVTSTSLPVTPVVSVTPDAIVEPLSDLNQPVATGLDAGTSTLSPVEAIEVKDQPESTSPEQTSSRSYLDPMQSTIAPINGATEAVNETKPIDIFAGPVNPSQSTSTSADAIDTSESIRDHDDTKAAVDASLGSTPPVVEPVFDLPPPPPLPDFSTLPPPLPDFSAPTQSVDAIQPERLGDIFAPQTPATQPFVTQSTLPPQPVSSVANDPGQFHIPGQQ